MLIGRFLLFLIMLSTFLIAALTTNLTTTTTTTTTASPAPATFSRAASSAECPEHCSIDSCFKSLAFTRNCTKLVRNPCDCCTVCLRTENEICGGHRDLYGRCEPDLLCYHANLSEQTGRCVKACLKFQCLLISISNQTRCECAHRRLPCDVELTEQICEKQTFKQELSYLKKSDDERVIDCSSIACPHQSINTSICPSDSVWIANRTALIRASSSSPAAQNLSELCCQPRGQCRCSTCPNTICGENSIIQVIRTGNPNLPGQCCDQFHCISNSKQCHHDQKIYHENETWSIDLCTTCTCRAGLVDCSMIQCPTYTHCGYMYKPENECCPRCGGCLNDRLHVQHMNSTWFESNGCMRCWCEDGRSRCVAEGCIAPPCDNPRQVANVCCPVCDDFETDDESSYSQELGSLTAPHLPVTTDRCPILHDCALVCEHGLAKDEQGCFQCACSTMSCPSPLCTLKFDRASKQYCSCTSPSNLNCGQLNCDKYCPYNYSANPQTGCPTCECKPCPQLICTKNCTYGFKRNEAGCPICVCETNLSQGNHSKLIELFKQSSSKQCHSGLFSYSNGEIWFDGCRQCLCHKGEQLCALISCPTPKCSQPILLPNRCCPSCPETSMLPEPIPSSQVCYASQYVTGEELEFDKCTKCICLHNIAFCSVAFCPPLACPTPIYDPSLCCPVCPTKQADRALPTDTMFNLNEEICILDDVNVKRAGELWKHDDCRSCHCPRGGGGQIECFAQTCEQNLPCSNPILKKGQCCPFCLPPTAAVAVCIFNHVQYRSGEYWNVSECHHCECLYGTIVCQQQQCPPLTCVHTVTLAGQCCPICRDQLPFIRDLHKFSSIRSHFGLTILAIFSILILILIFVILILICVLLRGGQDRSHASSDPLPPTHHHSPRINSKPASLFSYIKYDLISTSNDHPKASVSSPSHIPLTSLEQTSTHSMIGTNTTTTTTATSSSNHELEPGTWTEDDPILQCSVSTSNDGDDEEVEHETSPSDNDDSRQQTQSTGRPPITMYV